MAELGTAGLSEFNAELQNAKDEIEEMREEIPEVLDKATRDTAVVLHNEMKRNIVDEDAIDTGELIRSVEFSKEESAKTGRNLAKYSVGPTAEHAPYVEYGTDPHPITPDGLSPQQVRNASPKEKQRMAEKFGSLEWAEKEGDFPVLLADHPGTDAQPFFRPSVSRAEEDEWLADALDKHTTALFTGVQL